MFGMRMTHRPSKVIRYELPCPKCESSDAYHEYDDGHGYCFSCSYFKPGERGEYEQFMNNDDYSYQHVAWRGITAETMKYFNVLTACDSDGQPIEIGFEYPNGSCQIRRIAAKEFRVTEGYSDAGCFGTDKFNAGSSKTITIFEGALDALSGFQILRSPSISVKSASSARKDCQRDYEYINSFDRIYLAFDGDKPGQDAAAQVAGLFDFNKVYHVKLTKFKDANEFLQNEAQAEFKTIWQNAQRYLPEGVVSSFSKFDEIIDTIPQEPIATFPFVSWQEMTYGVFPGKAYLLTAPEGIGKTEVIRACEYHWLTTTDLNLGQIHLEEDKARQLRGLAGYKLRTPAHTPDSGIPDTVIKKTIRDIVKRDDRLHLYTHFGSEDPDIILDTIRFLVAVCGCRIVTLDHITQVVSGLDTDDERRALDKISTRLAMMLQELQFALIFISHVNDFNQTRGSRMISKMCDVRIELERDHLSEDFYTKNTTHTVVSKNRIIGRTGNSGDLYFDPATYILSDKPLKILPPKSTEVKNVQ